MTTTINILLNVPESYEVEELTRQLTEYGERLIARRKPSAKSRRRPSRDFLRSFTLPKGTTSEQLIDEHLSEKYGVGSSLENRCHVLITINDNDYKNADQSRIEILTPSAFVEKYINV